MIVPSYNHDLPITLAWNGFDLPGPQDSSGMWRFRSSWWFSQVLHSGTQKYGSMRSTANPSNCQNPSLPNTLWGSVFGPTNTSVLKAFRGSKCLLTRYLEDFGRLGKVIFLQILAILSFGEPGSLGPQNDTHQSPTSTLRWMLPNIPYQLGST